MVAIVKRLVRYIAAIGLLIGLLPSAPAVTTHTLMPVTTVAQATYVYNAGSVRVVSDMALPGSETSHSTIPSFDLTAKVVAAKGGIQEGASVYRVWGGKSGPWGESWTTVNLLIRQGAVPAGRMP